LAVGVLSVGAATQHATLPTRDPFTGPIEEDSAGFSIAAVTSVHNRLVVTVARTGAAPIVGHLAVTADGNAPSILPAQALPSLASVASIVMDDPIVQRRAPVRIDVTDSAGARRTMSVVIAPDEPNDIALAAAWIAPGGILTTVVFNRSPVPLRGNLVIAARGTNGPRTLLARTEVMLDVAAGGSQVVLVGAVGNAELGRMRIALATDAIDDADLTNDVYRP